jgi:hypothetical protein
MSGDRNPTDGLDPLVRLVQAQAEALDLIKRGLRPKQITCMTGLNIDRVNQLRAGLVPTSERWGRPPSSAATILRRPKLRAAACYFAGIHRRLVGDGAAARSNWPLFLEAYDIYRTVVRGLDELLPILPIDDAFTIVQALDSGGVGWEHCDLHSAYLIIPDHNRVWGCPYCTLAKGAWSTVDERPRPHGG